METISDWRQIWHRAWKDPTAHTQAQVRRLRHDLRRGGVCISRWGWLRAAAPRPLRAFEAGVSLRNIASGLAPTHMETGSRSNVGPDSEYSCTVKKVGQIL